MKKIYFSMFLAGMMALTGLTGCGHTHSAGEDWSFDTKNHWHTCECGERLDEASHTLQDQFCAVCDTEIILSPDGTALISRYDENGDSILTVSYQADASGVLQEDAREEYERNSSGVITHSKSYQGGFLFQESHFSFDAAGKLTGYTVTEYWEDESKVIYEYDASHTLIRKKAYDPAGIEIS